MYMDSKRYTIMYNNNTGMYHEPRHQLDYTGNTVIVELNSIYMARLKQNTLCCKISIEIRTCNVNISILASIHINKYLVLHECL